MEKPKSKQWFQWDVRTDNHKSKRAEFCRFEEYSGIRSPIGIQNRQKNYHNRPGFLNLRNSTTNSIQQQLILEIISYVLIGHFLQFLVLVLTQTRSLASIIIIVWSYSCSETDSWDSDSDEGEGRSKSGSCLGICPSTRSVCSCLEQAARIPPEGARIIAESPRIVTWTIGIIAAWPPLGLNTPTL